MGTYRVATERQMTSDRGNPNIPASQQETNEPTYQHKVCTCLDLAYLIVLHLLYLAARQPTKPTLHVAFSLIVPDFGLGTLDFGVRYHDTDPTTTKRHRVPRLSFG